MGGDAADNLIASVEAEEQEDVSMEAEHDDEEEMEVDNDDNDEDLEDRVMDLEDKLDELMAEFESLMGDGDDFDADAGGDAIEMDDTGEMGDTEEMMPMAEAVNLKAAPKPVTSEEGSVNKKSTVAANAGAKGPVGNTVKPVKTGTEMGGHHDSAAYKNTTKDLIGKVGNTPAQGTQKPSPATKPKLSQESGVNNKSIVPGQRG
jgi:hypothetical protein